MERFLVASPKYELRSANALLLHVLEERGFEACRCRTFLPPRHGITLIAKTVGRLNVVDVPPQESGRLGDLIFLEFQQVLGRALWWVPHAGSVHAHGSKEQQR